MSRCVFKKSTSLGASASRGFTKWLQLSSRAHPLRVSGIPQSPDSRWLMVLVNLVNHRKTMGKPWENGGFMGFDGIYPLVN